MRFDLTTVVTQALDFAATTGGEEVRADRQAALVLIEKGWAVHFVRPEGCSCIDWVGFTDCPMHGDGPRNNLEAT